MTLLDQATLERWCEGNESIPKVSEHLLVVLTVAFRRSMQPAAHGCDLIVLHSLAVQRAMSRDTDCWSELLLLLRLLIYTHHRCTFFVCYCVLPAGVSERVPQRERSSSRGGGWRASCCSSQS
jgi:hypothetical protein